MADVIFLAVCLFPAKKRVGSKKKSSENSSFFLFFLKNDQISTNTKTFKIRVFFHQNAQTSPQHPFKHISNNFGAKWAYLDTILVFLQHLWKKNYFLRKIEIFFSRDLLLFLIKIIFLFFCFFGKICHFMKKKITFWPLLSSLSYLPILLQKW